MLKTRCTSVLNKLPLPRGGRIDKIYHISDIHIRLGDHSKSRTDEYREVIDYLVVNLQKSQWIVDGLAVIIATGDFFEFKNKLN